MTSARTGSTAITDAERGWPSIADSSPSTSPGPRNASTASRPSSETLAIFTRPSSRIITRSDS